MDFSRLPSLPSAYGPALRKAGVQTVEDVGQLQPHGLMQILGVTLLEAHTLIRMCCAACSPLPLTVGALLRRERELRPFVATPLKALNALLNGGLAPSITEVVGPAGAGKTQFCLSVIVSAATWVLDAAAPPDAQPPTVVVIDTEGAFNPSRVQEIARCSRPDLYDSAVCGVEAAARHLTSLLSRIIVHHEDSARALFARIRALETAALSCERGVREGGLDTNPNLRLVVIDSITAPAWGIGAADGGAAGQHGSGSGSGAAQERSEQLAQQAGALKQLADSFAIPVLVTNQVIARSRRRPAVEASLGAGALADDDALSYAPASTALLLQQQHPREHGGEASALEIDNELAPALGPTWAHCVSTRLLLMPRTGAQPGGAPGHGGAVGATIRGLATIVKSPCAPQATLPYAISANGWGEDPQ